jgi:hypothetical protein
MFGNFAEFTGRNLERTENGNALSAKKVEPSFLNMPNFTADTLHDFHECVGNREHLLGGRLANIYN